MIYYIQEDIQNARKDVVYMKTVFKVMAAAVALVGAAVLLKIAAEVLGACSHNYIDVDTVD